MTDDYLQKAAKLLRPVPDFPKPGIMFWDINPVLGDPAIVKYLTTTIADYWRPLGIEMVAGFDSRGFLFGPMVAEQLDVPFTMIRKKGKLPPPTVEESYGLEYGADTLELTADRSIDGKRVLLLDDLLATGGTAEAGVKLVKRVGGIPTGFTCVTELPELGGRLKLTEIPVFSLLSVIDNQLLTDVSYCADVYAHNHKSGDLVLIKRLGDTPGVAMPGGRIDPHECAQSAASRELQEETGLEAKTIEAVGMLTDIECDPRGPKVSIVFEVTVEPVPLKPEAGKTDPFWVKPGHQLPDVDTFAFDHGPFVHGKWQKVA